MGKKEWLGDVGQQRFTNRKNYMQGPKSSPQQWQTYVFLFKRFLKNKKQPVVLVLGSTPELRDLALSYSQAKLLTVDINPKTVKKMTKLMKYKKSKRDKFILSDWVKMPIAKDSVDLIVGDGAIANLAAKQFDRFFKKANQVLKPDGIIILRDGVRIKKFIQSPEAIVKKSRQQNWHWFDLHGYLDFCSTGSWYNSKTYQASMAGLYQWIKQACQCGILNNQEFANLWPWKANLVHTILPKKKFLQLFEKYFTLIKICQPQDLRYQKFIYFFVGQPKK